MIAARASEETKRTAGELAGYLKRIAGADFVVQLPNGKSADLTPTPRTISVEQAQMKLAAGEAGLIKANAAVQAPGGENDEILVKQAKVAKIVLNLARKNLSASQAAEKQEVARLAAPPEMLPSSGIAVGMREEYSVPELQTPLAIHNDIDGREAFAIRAQPKRLLLISATERGVHHAAYRLLEALGCRWLATGEHWEIIPSTPDLSFGMDITDRPTIPHACHCVYGRSHER